MPALQQKPFYSQAEALRRLNLTQRKIGWLCDRASYFEQSGLRLFRVHEIEALAETLKTEKNP